MLTKKISKGDACKPYKMNDVMLETSGTVPKWMKSMENKIPFTVVIWVIFKLIVIS